MANQTCQCCGGELPPRDVWEHNRNYAEECTGSIDPATGRCRAFARDDLWTIDDEVDALADRLSQEYDAAE